MAPKDYDFCGWVTKNDLRCSDGRTIHQDAFAHQDDRMRDPCRITDQEIQNKCQTYTFYEPH